jgi:choline dehydrogenase
VSEKGIPLFDQQNGALMEASTGASLTDLCACGGGRSSVFRAYVAPLLQQGNFDLLTEALVTRVKLRDSKVVGVEVEQDGTRRHIGSVHEVIISAGALQTPKLLMQSGIGPAPELEYHGIPVLHSMPGIGNNLQDHTVAALAWQAPKGMLSETTCPQAAAFLRSSGNSSPAPDMYVFVVEASTSAADGIIWGIGAMLLRPESHGTLRLSGPHASDPPRIEGRLLSEKHDLQVLMEGMKFCQEVAQSEAMRGCIQRQLSPALSSDDQLATYIAQTASSCWHVCGTCKMGTDDMSVVNSAFEVHGLEGLRIADASVLPRVPLGNTMASTIIVGAEAVQKIAGKYGL